MRTVHPHLLGQRGLGQIAPCDRGFQRAVPQTDSHRYDPVFRLTQDYILDTGSPDVYAWSVRHALSLSSSAGTPPAICGAGHASRSPLTPASESAPANGTPLSYEVP